MPSIMICAPSNAAIDEIIVRILKRGLINSDSKTFIPNILRLGVTSEKKQSEDISTITLEHILKKGLCNTDSAEYKQHIHQKIELCKQDLINLEEMNNYPLKDEDIKTLKDKLNSLQADYTKSAGNKSWDMFQAESKLLKEADIILCTLSTSASEKLLRVDREFDLCIVDESAQTTEVSTLIPFRHSIRKVIMIGDHKQLPATVFSDTNKKLG